MSEKIKETRLFKMHNHLMHTIIFKQSGSLEKALSELIMNSIDANSTRIDIDFNSKKNTFTIVDDGKGFTKEEEIESFFDTLGTPHKDGDAKFGRFRIGRTQIFAYASTVWRSGTFRMTVDFLNDNTDGLSYTLERNLPFQKGCIINGSVYDSSKINSINSIECTLDDIFSHYFPYSDIPIYVNSELKIHPNSQCDWDIQTENAYYKFNDYRGAYIYNMGAFVKSYDGSYFGTGVDIVTKKALDINFARNDIILYSCGVFKEISKEIQDYVNKNRLKRKKLSLDEKKYFFNQFITREIEYHQIRSVKIFTDVFEKDFSLEDLVKAKRVTFSDGKSGKLAEMVHEDKVALVFNANYSYISNQKSFPDFIKSIWNMYDFLLKECKKEHPSYKLLKSDRELLGGQQYNSNIKDFESSYSLKHTIIETSQLTSKEVYLLKALRRLNDIFFKEYKKFFNCKKRKIVFGESLASNAWTDGVSYIAINKKFIPLSEFGIKFFDYMLKLIIHEYCHNDFTINEHPHNQEFYKLYHDITIKGGFNELKDGLILNISNLPKRASLVYHNDLERNGITAPKKLKQELSHIQESIENDNIESILKSFGKSYWENDNTFEDYIQELFLSPHGDDNLLYRYILTKNKILTALIKNDSFSKSVLFTKIDNMGNFVDFIIANLFKIYNSHTLSSIIKNINLLIDSYNSRDRDYNIEEEIKKELKEPLDYRKALKFIYKKNRGSHSSNKKGFHFCIVGSDTYNRLENLYKESNPNLFEKLEVNHSLKEKLDALKGKATLYLNVKESKGHNDSRHILTEAKDILSDINNSYIISEFDYQSFKSLGYTEHLRTLHLMSFFEYMDIEDSSSKNLQ